MELARKAAELGNINAISDAGSAAAFARAAIKGAGLNVRINLIGIEEDPDPSRMLDALEAIEKRADEVDTRLNDLLVDRGGLSF